MTSRTRLFAITLAFSAGATVALASDARIGGQDYAYADFYGNLVIYSHAGYKRIVVGKGYLAAELNEYSGVQDIREPNVVRLNSSYNLVVDCYRPPALIKGRSHMYGLRDGEIPEPSGNCR